MQTPELGAVGLPIALALWKVEAGGLQNQAQLGQFRETLW